jgi:hypothetical protein
MSESIHIHQLIPDRNELQQEEQTRTRLVTIVTLTFMGTIALMLPSTFFIPNRLTWLFIMIVEFLCVFALVLNRRGYHLVAGIVIVFSCEAGICAVLLTTAPFAPFNLPLYDLFLMGEILAVSLLPARSIWLVMLFNIFFVFMHLTFGSLNSDLTIILHTQKYNAWSRTASLQMMVSLVLYVFISHMNRLVIRAYHAQKQAQLAFFQVNQRQQKLEADLQEAHQALTEVQSHLQQLEADAASTSQVTFESQ